MSTLVVAEQLPPLVLLEAHSVADFLLFVEHFNPDTLLEVGHLRLVEFG